MAVKLNIQTSVTGQGQLTKLNSGLSKLGTQALIAKKRLASLERGAARSRATFAALGTTLKVGVGVGLAAVTFGIGKFIKDTFDAGKLTESLQVRFKLLFGTVEEGSKAFNVMNKFASKVPFSLEAIAAGSGNLAVISKDASELNKILEVTGNVAAATGLDFRQTAEQIQRSFAGGIASADVFRERGVRAMLGFEVGTKVSIEETKKRFFEVFANGGAFSKATKDFESTLEAQVSFVQDAYFRFRQAAAVPLFAGVKKQLIELVGNFKENDTQLKALAKTVGESIAKGFKNLGEFIKLIIENFDNLVKVIKIFLALKVVSFIGGIAAQLVIMGTAAKGATGAMAALNISMRANPLGILITVIQGAVIAWIAFGDKIKDIGSYISDKLNPILTELKDKFSEFSDADETNLDVFDEDIKNIDELRKKLKSTAEDWKKAANAKEAYREISLSQVSRRDKFAKFEATNPRGDMRQNEIVAANARAKELMSINEQIEIMNKNWIRSTAKEAGDAHRAKLMQVKAYREKLSLIGIDSKAIGGIIGDSWIEGIREGNSLLEITKQSFANVLISIANSMVKRSAELLVERLFNTLLDQRIMKQKQLNSAKEQEGSIMSGLLSQGSSMLSGLFKGGGNKLSGLMSFGKMLFMNKGGIVPGGAPYTDRVPAMLTPGEVVVPRNKTNSATGSTNITNINISGNVDQRAIDQIKGVIGQSTAEVGGANRTFQRNSQGVRGRGR
jgi:hypothetical protein